MDNRLSVGRLITFQLYWNQIQGAYKGIMSVLMSLTRAAGAAQRVLSLVDALPDIDPNAGTMVSHLDGAIKLEAVHFAYQMRPEHPVISGVNLDVGRGDVCALVGRSGGGKSTIVHLLMRFYDPTQGRILLDGWDLRDLNLKSVHKQMGLVAQDTQMFAGSIEENITYGLTSVDRDAMERAAKSANAHDFILRFPDGYATRVGERGVRLSGGQRQRVAIARMLLRQPKILLLDEATSSLDTESEASVQQALDRLIGEGGRTIVLVAHRLSTVRNANNIAVLDKGALVEQGTHEQLLEIKDGVYERLVRRQLNKVSNRILDDPEAEDTSDDINILLDDTSSHT
jgi:ABC-type multidrug transport system fused ATPase/permease subunit